MVLPLYSVKVNLGGLFGSSWSREICCSIFVSDYLMLRGLWDGLTLVRSELKPLFKCVFRVTQFSSGWVLFLHCCLCTWCKHTERPWRNMNLHCWLSLSSPSPDLSFHSGWTISHSGILWFVIKIKLTWLITGWVVAIHRTEIQRLKGSSQGLCARFIGKTVFPINISTFHYSDRHQEDLFVCGCFPDTKSCTSQSQVNRFSYVRAAHMELRSE